MELTAYVLLAWLSKANLTQKEIAKATGIVAWLAKQRNAYGGFSSTQVNSLLSTAAYQVGLDPMWRWRKNYCSCPLGPGTYNSIEREKKHVKNIESHKLGLVSRK